VGQQPNIELTEGERPREVLETAPPRRWRPTKAGLINSPEEQPTGGAFGSIGPDPGWGLRLVRAFDLPSDDPDLEAVVAALTMARAAAAGRGAVREDIEVALALCGFWDAAPDEVVGRRERWLAAVPHDRRPGQTAVSDVPTELLLQKPEQVHYSLSHARRPNPANAAS